MIMNAFNLPPGVLLRDIDGPPMPRCNLCGSEHNNETNDGLCPECHEAVEIGEKITATGVWPPLPEIRPIATVLLKNKTN